MKRLFVSAILGAFALASLSSRPVMAQSSGRVRGIVTDNSGGVLPGATVQMTNMSTQQSSQAVTTGGGIYAFSFLAPGEYSLQVTLASFALFTREPIVVNVAATAVVDVALTLAEITESVTVTGETPQLQIDTSMLGGVIENTMLTAVPLSSRNFTQVLALSPGVLSDVPDAGAFGRNSVNISAHGARPFENSMVMNGLVADNPMSLGFDDEGDKTGIPVPSPDAIEEFTVQTGLYDAEYGRQGGATINVVTKSGGNDFGGSVFEFFRNDALNANEFFRKSAGQPKPVLRQNQFGATTGGPIIQNKAFFFVAYQGTRQKNGIASSSTRNVFLPPLGDRSAAALGALYGGQSGLFGGVAVAPDGSNINPVALNILNANLPDGTFLIPDPQIILANGTGFSAFSVPAPFREDQFVGSFDYTISDTQWLTIKGFFSTFPSDLPFASRQGANLPGFGEADKKHNLNLSVSHAWVLNSTTVNELRVGYTRNFMDQQPIEPINAADIGMKAPVDDKPGIPNLSVSGLFRIGPSNNNDQHTIIDTFEISDTLSLTLGRHSIRFGGQFNPSYVDRLDVYLARGSINFNTFPDFLLGMSGAQNGTAFSNVGRANVSNGLAQRFPRFLNMAAFVQDDIRVSDRLALNLGLRWQFNSQQWDAKGRNGGFDRRRVPFNTMPPPEGSFLGFTLPANAELGGKQVPEDVLHLPYNRLTDEENRLGFSPRLGIMWQPLEGAENLVVRAGYGIFWSQIAGTITEQAFFDPWYLLLRTGGSTFPDSTLQNPFPDIPQRDEFPIFLPYTFPPTRATFIVDPLLKQPFTQHWGVNVQNQIGSWLLEVGYVGSRGKNLIAWTYPNQPLLASPENPIGGQTTSTVENINLRVPMLGWGATGVSGLHTGDENDSWFWSRYHALEGSVNKRYGQGVSLRASYTLSRATDNVGSRGGGRNQPLGSITGDFYDPDSNEGPSDFDRTHRLVASYLVELPTLETGNAGLRGLLNGWSVAGVTTIQSGRSFSIFDSRSGTIFGRSGFGTFAPGMGPDDVQKSGSPQDRLNEYFNTGVFGEPPVIGNGTGFGTAGRNYLRGPGQVNFDLALTKTFTVGGFGENARLQFRIEMFNLFNTATFGQPGNQLTSPSSFGVISNTVVAPRIMQLALKYVW